VKKHIALALSVVALSACALKGDVRRVVLQLDEMRAGAARADSAESVRAAELNARFDALIRLQMAVLDSIGDVESRLIGMVGDNRTDHTSIERQLVQIQELTGQSQARLSELGNRLRDRETQPMIQPPVSGLGSDSTVAGQVGSSGAREIYDAALQQLRRSSAVTARLGFRAILETYPNDPIAVDAQYMIGESWEQAEPDSAAVAFEAVARDHPDSERAPSALYKLGSMALRTGKTEEARRYFQRVVTGYADSDEADLAQVRLDSFNR
jgi:tol-pal system protein YbgF